MKTKDIIKNLLIQKPHLRDSNPKLIATYWFNELKQKKINPLEINGLEFMKMYADSKLTNIKTIERLSKEIKEKNTELRGKF